MIKSLLVIFLFINTCFASQIIPLVQLGEEVKKVGDELTLQVKKEKETFIGSHAKEIENTFILPYVYSIAVTEENGILFINAIVTNLNKKYQPLKINNEVVLFNIENEHLDKTELKLPEDYIFNLKEFSFKRTNILYISLSIFILILLLVVFKKKLYPYLVNKKKWSQKQNTLQISFNEAKSKEELESIYRNRVKYEEMFQYNVPQFEAMMSIIDRNQYMKDWKSEDLSRAQSMVQNINIVKKKYRGN